MATILILLVLKLGTIHGVYLGQYDYPNACEAAAQQAAQMLEADPDFNKGVEGAALICVPKPEA